VNDAKEPADAGARLGILFVHGIGDVADGNLRPGTETPAHAWLHLGCIGLDGTISQTTWLLAESWWAGAFGVPSFRDLIWTQPDADPRSVVALIVGLVLAAAALVVLFVFYPLALLPVAALRTFAAAVQRLLTATLGDSYWRSLVIQSLR
jgi:hypothetical protein